MSPSVPASAGRRATTLLTVTSVCLILLASAVWAAVTDNIKPTANDQEICNQGVPHSGNGPVCLTDNASLSFYTDSNAPLNLSASEHQAVYDTVHADFGPTDLVVAYDSTPIFDGPSETDIVYEEGPVDGSLVGAAWCDDPVNSGLWECDQQYVRIEDGLWSEDGLVCHETGHAVGLEHGEYSYPKLSNTNSALGCMVTPYNSTAGLGSNNTDNINSTY